MKYQLVLQFPAHDIQDFDSLIELEDIIEDALGNLHEVDGHDFGSGEMNIFIFTDDPTGAFESAKRTLEPKFIIDMKAAYRKIDGEDYTIIHPLNCIEVFEIK